MIGKTSVDQKTETKLEKWKQKRDILYKKNVAATLWLIKKLKNILNRFQYLNLMINYQLYLQYEIFELSGEAPDWKLIGHYKRDRKQQHHTFIKREPISMGMIRWLLKHP